MVTYVQLELFDLQAYTAKQCPSNCSQGGQIKKTSKEIEYKQLDLPPQVPDEGTNLKQAA